MNQYRRQGKSVWLAWFQICILKEFAEFCDARHDNVRAEAFRKTAVDLIAAVEEHGWDGDWYRRGFDDDGVPFGSIQNQDCKIDSIVQSWAVLSHSTDPSRAKKAMESVERLLLDSRNHLALLLTPPFGDFGGRESMPTDTMTPQDPGYIKGYPPGIRENGGHYNHAVTWLIAAFAELRQPEKALELFHMCSPVSHASSREKAETYKVEPYVAVGDIYSHPSHIGRGGWSWYTGSAGWLHRAGIEWILGFRLQGDHFTLNPCIPPSWPGYEVTFRHAESTYHITVENRSGKGCCVQSMQIDGLPVEGNSIPLTGTTGTHHVTAIL